MAKPRVTASRLSLGAKCEPTQRLASRSPRTLLSNSRPPKRACSQAIFGRNSELKVLAEVTASYVSNVFSTRLSSFQTCAYSKISSNITIFKTSLETTREKLLQNDRMYIL